ncbi:acetamidase/formamidase family protein [Deinococcus radiopugnans]|uniref:Formamidase n=1 Tax=Deinococcus radiopugnans ATCC 19172 TaxID=585398 RepID=A0A5C4Y7S1_9DEIO|nr:acetamidase/formamidase family protein [Deinococcus radiopugnans]MBB6014976.1 acetamidase/formamidase [Deinococcus radiopugnans ATCC 19172]TNM71615.1 formamidase [Deinococcus radiopugnans ATCC 19172]
MAHHHLSAEHIHTVWDRTLSPALRVRPGDTVTLDTLDASDGGVARRVGAGELEAPAELDALIRADTFPARNAPRGHPLTGPVVVEGAQPGDALKVEILEVRTAAWGWTACRPNGIGLLDAVLADEGLQPYTHFWDLRPGTHTDFLPGIRLPLAPFPGVIGVAPAADGPHPTAPPRQVGGNMDIRQLVAGATLYLPVEVPGALFSVGDLHAAQGDGELSGTGIETAGQITLRLGLEKDAGLTTPEFVTPTHGGSSSRWHATTGHDPDLMTAARTALRALLRRLTARGLSLEQAYVLSSACADLKISQVVDAPNYTVSAFLPLDIFVE